MSQVNTEVGVKINVDGNNAIKSVASIKKELSDANKLLQENIEKFEKMYRFNGKMCKDIIQLMQQSSVREGSYYYLYNSREQLTPKMPQNAFIFIIKKG